MIVLVSVVVLLVVRVLKLEVSQSKQGPPGFTPDIVDSVGMVTARAAEDRELIYEV